MRALHKVLVVDDDPVVGKSFNRVLSNKGYVVITAQNAQEALTKLQDGGYDVVFTDIRMPGMDGLELAEQVKAKQPWIPVVIVTGFATAANETRAREAGVSAFLHKPLSPEMIEGSAMHALLVSAITPEPAIVPRLEASPAEKMLPAPAEKENFLKNIALFMAAPFIGLIYAVLLPFVGMGILAGMAFKAAIKFAAVRNALKFVKSVALLIAAPFIGLAFIVLLPFVGLAMLTWTGLRALTMKVRAG
jgi:CheY-like chemotaxis protein